jgi:hypothetical protein
MDQALIASSNEQMFRALLILSGHKLADFEVEAYPDGSVRVRGPHGTASYSSTCWISNFGKHLYQGLFDEDPS